VEIAAAAAQCRDIFLSSDAGSQAATHARREDGMELPPLLAAVMGTLQRLRDAGRLPSLTPATQAIDMTVREWGWGAGRGSGRRPPASDHGSHHVTSRYPSSCSQDRLTLVPKLITLPDVERRLALGEYATVGSFIVDIRRLLAGIRCYSHLAPGSEVRFEGRTVAFC
jgi:hypothetical protein